MKSLLIIALSISCLINATQNFTEGKVTDFSQLIGKDRNSLKAYEQITSQDLPLVIKFYIVNCSPCKATAAGYEKMAQLFKGKAHFITLDAIKYEEIAKQFPLQTLPSWAIITQKKRLAFIKGSKNMADVQKILTLYVEKKNAALNN